MSDTRFNVVHPETDCIHRFESEAFVSVQDPREHVHRYLVDGNAKMH
jgi:hypothetical protein